MRNKNKSNRALEFDINILNRVVGTCEKIPNKTRDSPHKPKFE